MPPDRLVALLVYMHTRAMSLSDSSLAVDLEASCRVVGRMRMVSTARPSCCPTHAMAKIDTLFVSSTFAVDPSRVRAFSRGRTL